MRGHKQQNPALGLGSEGLAPMGILRLCFECEVKAGQKVAYAPIRCNRSESGHFPSLPTTRSDSCPAATTTILQARYRGAGSETVRRPGGIAGREPNKAIPGWSAPYG